MLRFLTTILSLLFALNLASAQVIYSGQNLPSTPKPADSIGVDNSWFLDQTTGNIWGPKNLGRWPSSPNSFNPNPSTIAYGMVGDGVVSTASLTGGSTINPTSATPTQLFAVPGIGPNGSTFQTTIASDGTLTTPPTFSTGTYYSTGEICPVTTPGTGVVQNEVFSIGSTFNAQTKCTVDTTGVFTATVASAGSGAVTTTPTCVVSGTTGSTGGAALVGFTALATMDGSGDIASVQLLYDGQYLINPTNLAAEPVTSLSPGCNNLVGATLSISMGIHRAYISQHGNYNSAPSAPQAPASSTGTSTGVTFTIPYTQSGAATWGTDNLLPLQRMAALAPAGRLRIPAGRYLTSCPQLANFWSFTNSVSLYGDSAATTTIQLVPSCTRPTTFNLFSLNNISVHWTNFTIDLNNSTFANYIPHLRQVGAAIFMSGNCQDILFDTVNILNARSGQIGLWIFESGGNTCNHIKYTNSRLTENTSVGPVSHAIYMGDNGNGSVANVEISSNIITGWNTGFRVTGCDIHDNDIGFQGYGPAVAPGFGAAPNQRAINCQIHHNKLHDSHGIDDGDADPNSGIEGYCDGTCSYSDNDVWNNAGAGIKSCGPTTIANNRLYDNGFSFWTAQETGSSRWNTSAGIILLRLAGLVNPTQICYSAGAMVHGNNAWDSYTRAVAFGESTSGLVVKQAYGLSEIGFDDKDFGKIFADNSFQYNSQGSAYLNGTEIADPISVNQTADKFIERWAEASISAGTTQYFYASSNVAQTGQSQFASEFFHTSIHNLTASIAITPVANPVVITFQTGNSRGTVIDTALTCTIPVAANPASCSIDDTNTAQTISPGDLFLIKVVNGSTSATGAINITFQHDLIQ